MVSGEPDQFSTDQLPPVSFSRRAASCSSLASEPPAGAELLELLELDDDEAEELDEEYSPAPALSFTPPETEVRGRVTLRARLSDARSLQGLSTLVTWDAGAFALVEGSVRPSRTDLALFHEVGPGRLQVDLAALGGTVTGEAELFRFELVPLAPPAALTLTSATEFASRRGEGVVRETAGLTEGGVAQAPRLPSFPGGEDRR